ncbi:MAG: hypothetical protein Kow0099_39480 [Candidatus Abyssubacteria bacterium]
MKSSTQYTSATFFLIVAASFLYQSLFFMFDYFPADEGLMVQVSQRMLQGETLYRDIFLPYTPLAWCVEAGIFRVFGYSYTAARIFPSFLFSLMCGIVFLWAREMMSFRYAVGCAVAAVLYRMWVWAYWQYFSYSVLAIFFAMAAGYFFVVYLKHGRRCFFMLLAGALAGLCFWSKPNVGVQTLAAMGLSLIACNVIGTPIEIRRMLRQSAMLLAGFVAVSVPFALILLTDKTFDDMLVHMGTLRAAYFHSDRHIPFPRPWPIFGTDPMVRENLFYLMPGVLYQFFAHVQETFLLNLYATPFIETAIKGIYYFPMLILVVGGAMAADSLRNLSRKANVPVFIFTFLFALLVFLQVFFFPVVNYLFIVLPPSIILLFASVGKIMESDRLMRMKPAQAGLKTLCVLGAVVYVCVSLWMTAVYVRAERQAIRTSRGTVQVHEARGRIFQTVYEYLMAETAPGDTVFVVPHNPLIYFFTDRRNPTRYDNLQPDTPGKQAQQEIIGSLERDKTRTVIFDQEEFPKKTRLPNAYPLLYNYIVENYVPVLDIPGQLTIYERKGVEEVGPSVSGPGK